MDNWLLLNDSTQVKSYAAVLKRLTDPAQIEEFRFMRVTRDMTIGQRRLLYKFLDTIAGEVEARFVSEEKGNNFALLSRSMRRPT
jgi:hypothetical protein